MGHSETEESRNLGKPRISESYELHNSKTQNLRMPECRHFKLLDEGNLICTGNMSWRSSGGLTGGHRE